MTLADPTTCVHHFKLDRLGAGECKFCHTYHPQPEPRVYGAFMKNASPQLLKRMRQESGGTLKAALDVITGQQQARR